MRVLTWNLKHGRAVPCAGRDLSDAFAGALGGWRWDVALLQEVPPWWPAELAARLGAEQRYVLTSRNGLLAARRAVAKRWPDLIKSNGGGANAILVRGGSIERHCVQRLCWLPERRWVHAVSAGGVYIANLHTAADARQGARAAAAVRTWAGRAPAILGGDFNVRELTLEGFERVAVNGVDAIYVRGLGGGGAEVLDRGPLSDHAPVAVTVLGTSTADA